MVGKTLGYGIWNMIADLIPFAFPSLVMCLICLILGMIPMAPFLTLVAEIAGGGIIYIGIMWWWDYPELKEASSYIFGRFRHK